MNLVRWLVWFTAAAVAILVVVLVFGRAHPVEEKVVELPVTEITAAPKAPEEHEEPDAPEKVPTATVEEVQEILLEGFEESWPKKARGQTFDIALTLHTLGEERGEDPGIYAYEYLELLHTTLDMQPIFRKGWDGGVTRAVLIAADLYRGALEIRDKPCSEIDPRFPEDLKNSSVQRVTPYHLLSMGYRESRLFRRVELGEIRGTAGERGMFQFLPQKNGRRGWIENKFMPRFKFGDRDVRCSPFDRLCATMGAANALAWIRCKCIQMYDDQCTTDVYMAGYGMNRMPTPAQARHHRGPVNARRFLCKARDDCDSLWPRSHDDDFALSL